MNLLCDALSCCCCKYTGRRTVECNYYDDKITSGCARLRFQRMMKKSPILKLAPVSIKIIMEYFFKIAILIMVTDKFLKLKEVKKKLKF